MEGGHVYLEYSSCINAFFLQWKIDEGVLDKRAQCVVVAGARRIISAVQRC